MHDEHHYIFIIKNVESAGHLYSVNQNVCSTCFTQNIRLIKKADRDVWKKMQ